jgi:hypothetical protein
MINSITVDLNGQSMVQQNQLIDIYNNFRLLTSESWTSQNRWSTIGFYPDLVSEAGLSTDNNQFAPANTTSNNSLTNEYLTERLSYINLDSTGLSLATAANSAVSNLIPVEQIKQFYLSHISNTGVGVVNVSSPFVQYSVKATIMLKDIHPLFEVMPISKSLLLIRMMLLPSSLMLLLILLLSLLCLQVGLLNPLNIVRIMVLFL